jgi:Homeodomain-like domain
MPPLFLDDPKSDNLTKLRLDRLQKAVRSNKVSFPSQVPALIKHSSAKPQNHIILLFFVQGWSCNRIAKRYNITRQHVWHIVSEWRRHAVALGYLQIIPPPAFTN